VLREKVIAPNTFSIKVKEQKQWVKLVVQTLRKLIFKDKRKK
jgi:hypothetical protein